jgi:predicted nucleotidyltransferase component of viral defense system
LRERGLQVFAGFFTEFEFLAYREKEVVDYRFSEDLAFTLRQAPPLEEIRTRLEPVYAAVAQQSGIVFAFDRQDPRVRTNTHTFYLREGGYHDQWGAVFPSRKSGVLRGYAEFADVPENRSILLYPLDEIAAEKTVALADPARNEPRDLNELWYLTVNKEVQLVTVHGKRSGIPAK